jgi:hypothetical protein
VWLVATYHKVLVPLVAAFICFLVALVAPFLKVLVWLVATHPYFVRLVAAYLIVLVRLVVAHPYFVALVGRAAGRGVSVRLFVERLRKTPLFRAAGRRLPLFCSRFAACLAMLGVF